ncbi:hypothetical protein V0U79_05915 [Hyphobacterium sp. HN65]|uniref:PPM-type phosphatase domain-containing protein n=1 Tax=Hyphobacterium lacteum TaxID=3116575 RepID=A0ABU7LQM5_9PROT|nr:hypothetical protein [Hyphobacterium sp. HN65]MEE2525894.1 hypothetical protein [Hyphobacterium sp. HN65]
MLPGLTFLDAVNFPSGSGTGDDRYGFDEGAGTAWVVDGATDVGTMRLFPEAIDTGEGQILGWESDAAWYAERLSERFTRPPEQLESTRAYLERCIRDMAAKANEDAAVPIAGQPRHNLPSAGGIWMRRQDDHLEFAGLGDCMAIVEIDGHCQIIGDVEGIRAEYRMWGKAIGEQDRAAGFAKAREIRNVMNTDGNHWVFSLHPEAAAHAGIEQVRLRRENRILLMSDGFFRLIEPYQAYTAAQLMAEACEPDGLPALANALRARERNPEDDAAMGRLKTSDDACAVLVEIS